MVGSNYYVSLLNGFRVVRGDININMTSTNIVPNDKAYTRVHIKAQATVKWEPGWQQLIW